MGSRISSNRKMSFDIIRIVAILSVVLVHVSGYFLFQYPDPTKTEYIIGNIFNGLSRAGVPLFVMLSGALLLNENKKFDPKIFFKKSLLWIVLLLIGWLLFYAFFYSVLLPLCTGGAPSAAIFTGYLLTFKGSNYPHLWYLFMVTGAYLLIPVLRLFVKQENRAYIFWMIIGCVVVQFGAKTLDVLVPSDAAITVSGFMGKFHMEGLTGYIGYFLLGWYLSTFAFSKMQREMLYIVGFAAAVADIVIVQMYYASIPGIRGHFYSELAFGPMVFGVAVFVLILQLYGDRTTTSNGVIALSNYSFGIYMIHVVYLELFTKMMLPYETFAGGVLAYILLSYTFVLITSLLTTAVIGKIPYVKKILFIK